MHTLGINGAGDDRHDARDCNGFTPDDGPLSAEDQAQAMKHAREYAVRLTEATWDFWASKPCEQLGTNATAGMFYGVTNPHASARKLGAMLAAGIWFHGEFEHPETCTCLYCQFYEQFSFDAFNGQMYVADCEWRAWDETRDRAEVRGEGWYDR